MPFVPSFAKANNLRKHTLQYAGQDLTIWYRIDAITPEALDAMSVKAEQAKQRAEAGEEKQQDESLIDMIREFVSDWDVAEPVMNGHMDESGNALQALDAEGNPVWQKWPIDREHLRKISYAAQLAMVDAMIKDMQPGEATAGASSAG